MKDNGRRRRERVAKEVHKNLEEAALGKSVSDPSRGFGVSWVDGNKRQIDFIPDLDNRGLCVYFYVDGKRTAQVGLSIKAAVCLINGIGKMFSENPEMIEPRK